MSDQGCEEANAYAIAFPDFLKSKGYAPISKVVVMDPRPDNATSNPLRTVFSLIHNCNITDIQYIDGPSHINNITYSNDGSTLMCFDAVTIDGADKPHNDPGKNSILRMLSKKFNVPKHILGPPVKGSTVYVFSQGHVDYYHLDVGSKKIKSGFY